MIEEMVCSPNPQWVRDFKKELIEKFNISRTDAILISGKVCKIVREQKAIDDDHLHEVKKMVIDKACEWLKKQGNDWWEGYGLPFSMDDFSNAMMEEQK